MNRLAEVDPTLYMKIRKEIIQRVSINIQKDYQYWFNLLSTGKVEGSALTIPNEYHLNFHIASHQALQIAHVLGSMQIIDEYFPPIEIQQL